MSNDGLLPKLFSDLHPQFRTPYKSNMVLFVFVGLLAGLLPGDITGDLTSIGTLFAFVLVSVGVWILRRKRPDMQRPFRTPFVPLVPILGIVVCGGMIIALDNKTQITALLWMIVGLLIYFSYSKSHSQLAKPEAEVKGPVLQA